MKKRPTVITVTCILFGISLLYVLLMAGTFIKTLNQAYGEWYGPFWLGSVVLSIASLVGYWMMKKWGVYLYTLSFAIGSVVGLIVGLPFTVFGIVVPVMIIAIGFKYIAQMS